MKHADGFSFIELSIVVAIVVTLAALAIPAVTDWQRHLQLVAETEALASLLYQARSWAISEQTPVEVEFSADLRSCRLRLPDDPAAGTAWRSFAPQVQLVELPSSPVRFYSLGHASLAGTYRLQSGSLCSAVVVATSGRVRIQYGEAT